MQTTAGRIQLLDALMNEYPELYHNMTSQQYIDILDGRVAFLEKGIKSVLINHICDYVDVGFMQSKLVCKHCDGEKK